MIIKIFQKEKQFTLAEANELVKLANKITSKHKALCDAILIELERAKVVEIRKELESKINIIVDNWQNKMKAIGFKTNGLWIADMPSDANKLYCWRFPEETIQYEHSLTEGFRGRTKIV